MRGATDVYRWTYALAGVALDLLKSGLPILGATAWHDSKPARSLACWLYLPCSPPYRSGAPMARRRHSSPRSLPARQRDALNFAETSAEAVRTAEDMLPPPPSRPMPSVPGAVAGISAGSARRKSARRVRRYWWRRAIERRPSKRPSSTPRSRRPRPPSMRSTRKRRSGKPTHSRPAWPRRSVLIKTSLPLSRRHSSPSLSNLEAASGSGFWLVFGHAAPPKRREVDPPSTALVPIDPSPPQKLHAISKSPAEIIERFFLEVVRPALNRRIQSLAVWSALHTVVRRSRPRRRFACQIWQVGALAQGPHRRSGLVSRLRTS